MNLRPSEPKTLRKLKRTRVSCWLRAIENCKRNLRGEGHFFYSHQTRAANYCKESFMAEPSYEELRVRLKETEQKLESRELKLRELGVDDWEPKPVAPKEPVVIKTCNHIRENGAFCRSAAVTGREARKRDRKLIAHLRNSCSSVVSILSMRSSSIS